MPLPSEISDLAKQLQAKLGEAFANCDGSFEICFEQRRFADLPADDKNFQLSVGDIDLAWSYDSNGWESDPAALVAAAMARAKGAGPDALAKEGA